MRNFGITLAIVFPLFGQEDPTAAPDRERALWSTEFRQSRLAAPSATKQGATPTLAGLMLGLTAWRLRPAQPAETVRLLVHGSGTTSAPTAYAPERIGAGTMLSDGDMVRITVEPGRAGYLYIASREVYEGGTTSDTFLVFPRRSIRGGRARVAPGEVVEVPEWNNPQPYLTLERGRPGQIGEQVFLLLTQTELPNLMVEGKDPLKLPLGTIAGWVRKWGTGVHMLDTPDKKGSVLTAVEQRAALQAGLLRPGDPISQILYRAPATVQDGILATFTLRIKP